MRIIHTSDWHLGKNLNGNSRLKEQEAFLDFFASKCEALGADLVIIAGDIYDSPNPPAQAEELFYTVLKKISRGGDCLSFIIAGNHDSSERLTAATPLAREHGIIMMGSPKTEVSLGEYGKHKVVSSKEGVVEIKIGKETAILAALPYLSERRLGELIYSEGQNEEERSRSYGDKVREIFTEMDKYYRKDAVNLAVSHIFALKNYESTSERAASLGASFLVDSSVFPEHADYVALGHVHKPMRVSSQKNIVYSGSPIHYSVDEISYEKKFFIVDLQAGQKPVISEEAIPIFKPIEKWNCKSVQEAIQMCKSHSNEDSWVYLEIETDSYIKDSEIKEMKAYKADIADIQPIIKTVQKDSFTKKFSELSFSEQFEAFYKYRYGVAEVDTELLKIFNEILEKVEEGESYETY